MARFLRYWFPVFLWMGCIFGFSTDLFSSNNTAGLLSPAIKRMYPEVSEHLLQVLNFLIRKSTHVVEYAFLSLLVFRALRQDQPRRWTRRWAMVSMLVVVGYALSDEWHQSFTVQREASLYDVGLDTLGGLLMQSGLAVFYKRGGKGEKEL